MEGWKKLSLLPFLTALACLLCLTSPYTLDGQWQLTNQHLNYTKTNPNITFKFVNHIVTPAVQPVQDVLNGPTTKVFHKGTNKLTVFACKTLTYNYYIVENTMYLQQISRSAAVR